MPSDGIAQRNARFARQAVERLIAAGCQGFVLSPGSRSTPLVAAIAGSGARAEVVLDERSAGFFALGWAKAARAPVAVVCTSGSAGAHFFPAVIEAYETGVPLLVVTADRPPELQAIGAPQTTRQDGFFGHHVKGRLAIAAADEHSERDLPAELDGLAALSATGKPGPVHLNIGFREPLWDPGPALIGAEGPPPAAGEPTEERAMVALPEVAHGLLVVGPVQEARADAAEAVEALAGLAGRRGWPVLADVSSGLRSLPASAQGLIDGYDVFLKSGAARAALRPELVVHVGRMPVSRTLFEWLRDLEDDGVDVLHLSTDGQPHSLGRAPRVIDVTWQQLARSCQSGNATSPRSQAWLAAWERAAGLAAAETRAQAAGAGLWEGAVARAAAVTPAGSRLVLASSMPIRDMDSFVARLAPGTRCLVNRGVSGIDGLVATAAGVAAQDPGRRVRLVLGDLAFQHDLGSLAVAATRPNLEIVVVNNGGGGIFEFLPIREADELFDRFFLTPQTMDIRTAAAAFGIETRRCRSLGELDEFLAAPEARPRIAEVVVDRAHNVTIHQRISSAVVARLDQAFLVEGTHGEGTGAAGRSLESRKRL